jgi:hypothetical protein
MKSTKSKQIFTLRYADRRRNRANNLARIEPVFRPRQENTEQTEKEAPRRIEARYQRDETEKKARGQVRIDNDPELQPYPRE